MAVAMDVTGGKLHKHVRRLKSGERVQTGDFRMTPLLTDHSAFDAYMLVIEAAGRHVLYTGDFRKHGRKSALVEKMMADPSWDIAICCLWRAQISAPPSG